MKLFDIISISLLLALSIVLAITFFQAYDTGVIEVHINEYGEAPYEAVLIVLALIGGVTTLVRSIIRIIGR